ncbi:GTP-dependent phosphoenolpyruvate carboxykinase [Deinococcus budaensis]|uniref:GTP-dependent phosphoenolpyruvate carboxykinase n=1 Tax=Deinococcus budaensis TaxID=1665626 RepID=A0A7W8LQK2_9DEIO|nr:GTP-dependent phosphoenolpyruvate carboxykinase [Deinococcus budaensis]
MPIEAFIFGGQRSTAMPLGYQSFNWTYGVYAAATMGSETTAAALGATGEVRRDPFTMLPFVGYHMADYFNHWLDFGRHLPNPPRVFLVNWFRRGDGGQFLWPGFGENMRVLKGVVDRAHGRAAAIEGPLGWMPRYGDLDWRGLDFSEEQFNTLISVNRGVWQRELTEHDALFTRLYDQLPKEFLFIRGLVVSGLWRAPEHWGPGRPRNG